MDGLPVGPSAAAPHSSSSGSLLRLLRGLCVWPVVTRDRVRTAELARSVARSRVSVRLDIEAIRTGASPAPPMAFKQIQLIFLLILAALAHGIVPQSSSAGVVVSRVTAMLAVRPSSRFYV